MLKNRLAPAATVFVLFLVLSPLPSQAIPGAWTPVSRPAASLFAKMERRWSLFLHGGTRPAQPERPHGTKQGCAIDPNGHCGPGTGTTNSTAPEPTDSSGS